MSNTRKMITVPSSRGSAGSIGTLFPCTAGLRRQLPSVGTVAGRQQGRRHRGVARLGISRTLAGPMTATLPPITDVQDSSRSLGLAASASELHGGLSGWL